jgi:hypothetical protein
MGPVLPIDIADFDQLQVCFVDQGRGLDRPPNPLVFHAAGGNPPKLLIDSRSQPVQGGLIAVRPVTKKASGFRGFLLVHPLNAIITSPRPIVRSKNFRLR